MVFKKGIYEFVEEWNSNTLDHGLQTIPVGAKCLVTGWNGDNHLFFDININLIDYCGYIDSKYIRFIE